MMLSSNSTPASLCKKDAPKKKNSYHFDYLGITVNHTLWNSLHDPSQQHESNLKNIVTGAEIMTH